MPMEIEEVSAIIDAIADGFETRCVECLDANRGIVLRSIHEQMYSGLGGDGQYLSPTYDDDPFFDEPGPWRGRSADYKAWKRSITPPLKSRMLGLDARPDAVPNLYIDGTFYSDISMRMNGSELELDPGDGNGPAILEKYGERLFQLGPTAVGYFNDNFLRPSIDDFIKECGYEL